MNNITELIAKQFEEFCQQTLFLRMAAKVAVPGATENPSS